MPNIIVTQPRRVAAIALAERVAIEQNSPPPGQLNSTVGFNVRLGRKVTATTSITFMTVGVLLRMLTNPEGSLSTVTHIVIDEVHERDLNTDFVLALLKRLLQTDRKIRIVIMSATVNAAMFEDYFSSALYSTSAINIPGRSFPVSVLWLEDCENLAKQSCQATFPSSGAGTTSAPAAAAAATAAQLSPIVEKRIDENFICALVSKLCKAADGAILIFMPGKVEIDSLVRQLKGTKSIDHSNTIILPLYSSLPQNQQTKVFVTPPSKITKIIVSTNVAETSLTIPDVKHVIDTGIVKETRYKPSSSMSELATVWASQASQNQRSGRAGR